MKRYLTKTLALMGQGIALALFLCQSRGFSDIIPTNRVTPWLGNVGVEGGIPNRTTIFKTLFASNSAVDINIALATCPSNQVVQLTDGIYNLNTALLIGRSGVTLRGMGSNTVLHFVGGNISGNGYITVSGFNQNNVWAAENQGNVDGSANWISGYSQGSTNIVLSSTSGLSVGSIICLDQLNDNVDFSSQGVDGFCNYCGRGGNRSQEQWVKVTAMAGNTVSISSPIYMPNWQSSQNPQAWWVSGIIFNSGIESLNVDGSGGFLTGGLYPANINLNGTWNCWVSNVWSEWGQIAHLVPYGAGRTSIQHCWFQGSKSSASLSYGVYQLYSSGSLVENNIFNGVDAPIIPSTGNSGCVFSYNYVTNVLFSNPASWMDASMMMHGAGNCMNLYEGNYIGQWDSDLFHGSSAYETLFRCRVTGNQTGKSANRIAVIVWPTNHFINVVGNVLGTPGINNSYAGFVGGPWPDPAIYNVGFGRTGGASTAADDPVALTTLYLHGNYDVVNAGIVWASTNADRAIPASLYYPFRPSWFRSGNWPPFDPGSGSALAATTRSFTNLPAGYRLAFGTDAPFLSPANLPPVAVVNSQLTSPMTFAFSSSGSHDPEGVSLTYLWTFGDGQTSISPNPTIVYRKTGVFQASLQISDGLNTTATNITVKVSP
jgi:hypothetical protein